MRSDGSKESPDRAQTDESLKTERRNIDRVVAERRAAVERDADRVVDRAREHADAVLSEARDKADEQLNRPGTTPQSAAIITEARALEDDVVRDERASADDTLRLERERTARVLMALLPFEREATDQYLLTERVRSDDALSHRDNFLGIVSHDLRDLLGGIVMAAALLSKRAPDTEEGAETRAGTERIQRYAARMNRLIGDLVDVASIDAGRLAVAPGPADVALLLAEAVDTFRVAAAAKELSLSLEIAEQPLMAQFDYGRMLQVLANIFANAIKFTPAGGGIRVAGKHVTDAVQVSVSDTGAGIPPDMLEAIFERFRQVAERDRRGLGLGLYISKCLVEAHGGTMWATSTLHEGTTIHFTLPTIPGV